MNINMYIPVLIVVLSNTFYHICAKSTPGNLNTFASLAITYAVGTAVCLILYFVTTKNANILAEFRHLHWSSFVLGIAVVGLEAGFLLMYKMGWNVSTGQIVSSAFLAVILLAVGYFLYKEQISVKKAAGVAVCIAGLYLINK